MYFEYFSKWCNLEILSTMSDTSKLFRGEYDLVFY